MEGSLRSTPDDRKNRSKSKHEQALRDAAKIRERRERKRRLKEEADISKKSFPDRIQARVKKVYQDPVWGTARQLATGAVLCAVAFYSGHVLHTRFGVKSTDAATAGKIAGNVAAASAALTCGGGLGALILLMKYFSERVTEGIAHAEADVAAASGEAEVPSPAPTPQRSVADSSGSNQEILSELQTTMAAIHAHLERERELEKMWSAPAGSSSPVDYSPPSPESYASASPDPARTLNVLRLLLLLLIWNNSMKLCISSTTRIASGHIVRRVRTPFSIQE